MIEPELKNQNLSEYGHGYFAHKKETAKILRDKLNHLKSDLAEYKAPKLTKDILIEKVLIIESQINLLEWLQKKINV